MNYSAPEYNFYYSNVRSTDQSSAYVTPTKAEHLVAGLDPWYWSCEDQFGGQREAALRNECIKRRVADRNKCAKFNQDKIAAALCDGATWFQFLAQVDKAAIDSGRQKAVPVVALNPSLAKKILSVRPDSAKIEFGSALAMAAAAAVAVYLLRSVR